MLEEKELSIASQFGDPVNGTELSEQLTLLGLSQTAFAEEAGVSQPTVSAAIAGHPISRKSRRAIATALAKGLGISFLDASRMLMVVQTASEPEQQQASA